MPGKTSQDLGWTSIFDVSLHHTVLTLFVCLLLIDYNVVTSLSALEENGIVITHSIDKDAVLTCTVKDLGNRRVIWTKMSDPYPISVGGTRFTPSKKYRVQVGDDPSSCILTIKDIELADAGEYQCRATGPVYVAETLTLNIQAGPEFTHLIPTETKIRTEIGSNVILPCHVENLKDKLVLWRTHNNEVVALRKKVYSGDKRFKVIHDTSRQWSLQIKDVQESDYGHYTCVVNSEPVLTRTVQLINSEPVRTAPVLMKDTNYRKKVEVMAGETVDLTCNFYANPPADVVWYRKVTGEGGKKNEKIGKGSTLTLEAVKVEQSGQYICAGNNGMGTPSRGKTKLIVIAPPTTTPPPKTTTMFVPTGPSSPQLFHKGGDRVGQVRGRNVELTCVGVGQPRPTVSWKRHGQDIRNNYKYKVTEDISGAHTSTSTLLVRTISSNDFGEFECMGHNQLGLVTIKFEIYEHATST